VFKRRLLIGGKTNSDLLAKRGLNAGRKRSRPQSGGKTVERRSERGAQFWPSKGKARRTSSDVPKIRQAMRAKPWPDETKHGINHTISI
jgi:hypothetical protein